MKQRDWLVSSAASIVAAASAVAWAPGTAQAGGLYLPGYGSQGQPRAGAFVAKADDASALYYNPAGLAKQRGTSVHLGFNFVDFDQTFQRAGTYETPTTGDAPAWAGQPYPEVSDDSKPALGFGGFQGAPTVGLVTDLGGRSPLVLAVGVITEHAFPERNYGRDYDFQDPTVPPPPGRYDVTAQDASMAFPSLAAGYRVNAKLDVGVRVSWGFGGSHAKQYLWGLRNYEEETQYDGLFEADVFDGFVPAAGAGVLYRPSANIELGASYQTPRTAHFKGEGTARLGSGIGVGPDTPDMLVPENMYALCDSGGTVAALKTCISLTLPQTASVGGRYIFRDRTGEERGDVEFDAQWEDWSNGSDIDVIVDAKSGLTGLALKPVLIRHGFHDTWSFRLGGAYAFDVGPHRLTARAGAAYDTAAAPTSWTRLAKDGLARATLGAGLAFDVSDFTIELGGGMVIEGDVDVADTCNPTTADPGCSGTGNDTPTADRDRPDPAQPLNAATGQVESPFNAGHYEQSYVLLSAGVSYRF